MGKELYIILKYSDVIQCKVSLSRINILVMYSFEIDRNRTEWWEVSKISSDTVIGNNWTRLHERWLRCETDLYFLKQIKGINYKGGGATSILTKN